MFDSVDKPFFKADDEPRSSTTDASEAVLEFLSFLDSSGKHRLIFVIAALRRRY